MLSQILFLPEARRIAFVTSSLIIDRENSPQKQSLNPGFMGKCCGTKPHWCEKLTVVVMTADCLSRVKNHRGCGCRSSTCKVVGITEQRSNRSCFKNGCRTCHLVHARSRSTMKCVLTLQWFGPCIMISRKPPLHVSSKSATIFIRDATKVSSALTKAACQSPTGSGMAQHTSEGLRQVGFGQYHMLCADADADVNIRSNGRGHSDV